jgi:hypothetical protein
MFLVPSISGLFKWRQFEPAVIFLAVGWYLRFSLSNRYVEERFLPTNPLMPSFIAWQARLNHRQIPGVAAAPVHALQVDDCLMRLSLSVRSLPPSGMSCCAIPFTGGQVDPPDGRWNSSRNSPERPFA